MSQLSDLLHFVFNWKVKQNTIVNSMPLEVSIEVTNVCNFKCAFCSQSNPAHFDSIGRNYLTPANTREILAKVREFGYDKTLLHWTLDGEPFLNKSFDEICEIGKEYGFTDQYFATNCLLVTRERVRTLPKGVDFTFTVDYCADREYFEQVRGTKNSWEQIKDNITQIILDEDLSNIRFTVYDISTFEDRDKASIEKKAVELRTMFPANPRLKFLSKTFHNATGFLGLTPKQRQQDRHSLYNLCPYPWSSLTIASNGDVVACCRDLEHKTVLGNVFEASLADIWNNKAYQSLRRNLVNKTPQHSAACAECDMPYDDSKFSAKNIFSTIRNRLQIFR